MNFDLTEKKIIFNKLKKHGEIVPEMFPFAEMEELKQRLMDFHDKLYDLLDEEKFTFRGMFANYYASEVEDVLKTIEVIQKTLYELEQNGK